jgi:hypothetical protein
LELLGIHFVCLVNSNSNMDERKQRIQQIVELFPGGMTTEVNRRDMKCWVQGKGFAHWLEDDMPDNRPQFMIKVTEAEQIALLIEHPEKYHRPSANTWKKWLGINLDLEPLDWLDIETRLLNAYAATAPKSLSSQLTKRNFSSA